MEDPTGWLQVVSTWMTALATFAYENIGFTLFLGWVASLFVFTEVAKPFLRRLFTTGDPLDAKLSHDYQLVMESMTVILGMITGYWVFPAILSTTAVTEPVPGWTGFGAGCITGWVTKKAYDLKKNKEFVRATKVVVRKILRNIPIVKAVFTDEDIKYIEEGTQRAGEGDMVTITPEMIAEHRREHDLLDDSGE